MRKWFGKRRSLKKSKKRSNDEWIRALSAPQDDQAIEDLRIVLIQGLKSSLYKYVDQELHQFVQDVAQDSLLKILDKIHTFRGESRFLTWSMKVAVREGLSELRRKKWNDIPIEMFANNNQSSEDSEINDLIFSSDGPKPDQAAHENFVLDKVMQIIEKELSEKQKNAIMALMVHDMPVTIVAEQMGIKRNALYKLVHDARVNLKKKMIEDGVNPEHIYPENW